MKENQSEREKNKQTTESGSDNDMLQYFHQDT